MKKLLIASVFLISVSTNAFAYTKTINYVVMPDNTIYCLMGRLQVCNKMKDTIIKNNGIYKADGVFRSVTYDPFKKPEYKKCGLIYNPKDGTSKIYKC